MAWWQCARRWSIKGLILALLALIPLSALHAEDDGPAPEPVAVSAWQGHRVERIEFAGVPATRLAHLVEHLAQQPGQPLERDAVARSLRQLYATGLYDTVEVSAASSDNGVLLRFSGEPRSFVSRVNVYGARGAQLNAQLLRASGLNAGERFTSQRLEQAIAQMRLTLALGGFHEPVITPKLDRSTGEQLVDITFTVQNGPQARLGNVSVDGDTGLSPDEFRRHAHLRPNQRLDRETTSRAVSGVLKHYQNQDRLEAEIKLAHQSYDEKTRQSDLHFTANRGPVVRVEIEGAPIEPEKLRHVLPVFEEGAVDDDLLNEGNRRLRDYFQRLGYFDVKVEHRRQEAGKDLVQIVYSVRLGLRRSVERVNVDGNHYFDAATLRALLSVHVADSIDHRGAFSQALMAADIAALTAVYQNNGFSDVHVVAEPSPAAQENAAPHTHVPSFGVTYHITEGAQQRVASVEIVGAEHSDVSKLRLLMNTSVGQPFSPQTVAADRDALLTDYLSRGFDRVRIEVEQTPTDEHTQKIAFRVHEGQQIFVRRVLITGLDATRPSTIAHAITLKPGDPLNQTALADMQRNLYDISLFNQVDTAVQNPNGNETEKTVLVQLSEARRWALTYGIGFEAQTGTPENNCQYASNANCSPNGKTGVSPRLLLDVTRNNLFGREQSASLRGTYGLLEQKIDLLYQNPRLFGDRDYGLTFSAGYAETKDVTTYVANKLEGAFRLTEHFDAPGRWMSKANTMVYEMDFRRVQVLKSSLQVYSAEIPDLSRAVRVAGPGISWLHDTRDSLLDAHSGTYFSVQEFFSNQRLGGEAQFNRIDITNSNFLSFDKRRFVLARNTRYGQERSYGQANQQLLPLPERLYAGGPSSHRGFGLNAAGPRDPVTGYPIGGAGTLINSTELRLPPPTLPWIGNTVSFVLFHDMGNVFANAGDAWKSIGRLEQPHRSTCNPPANVNASNASSYTPTGPINSSGQQGACSFAYFSHAPGLGLRYHTPVGPIRFDFSYNLNPPVYPAIQDYTNPSAAPHLGAAPHFNFFFSLGQTF